MAPPKAPMSCVSGVYPLIYEERFNSLCEPIMSFGSNDLMPGWVIHYDSFIDQYEKIKKPPFGRLSNIVRNNLIRFLKSLVLDHRVITVRSAAYILATAIHEGRSAESKWAMTWSPVSETKGANSSADYFNPVVVRDYHGNPLGADGEPLEFSKKTDSSSVKSPRAIADKDLGNYYDASLIQWREYYGRGYVQLTHMDNYRSMDEALGMKNKLLLEPDRALVHSVAFDIMVYGMVNGSFRGAREHVPGRGMVGGHRLFDYESSYVDARAIINSPSDKAEEIAKYAECFQLLIQSSRLA